MQPASPSSPAARGSTGLLALLALAAVVPQVIVHFASDGVYDIGDGVNHYLFSRYSWRHPELFLHHWAKPLFTLLSSPLAQLGYTGIVCFNLLCAAATAFCAGEIVRAFGLRLAPAAVLLAVFMPLYFTVAVSGLTEPLFALVLVLSVLLMVRRRHASAALVVSFLPFARTEGFFLLPLFAVVLVLRRKPALVPLLATGTAVYSVVGGIHYGDLLWVIHRNPYRDARDIYGSGDLLHFLRAGRGILGTAGCVVFVGAFLSTLRRYLNRGERATFVVEQVWLVFGAFLTYLALHSLLWRFGLFASFGLMRVMAAVSPLGAVGIVIGMNDLRASLPRREWVAAGILALTVGANIYQSVAQPLVPFRLAGEALVMRKAAEWIGERRSREELIYCQHPFITFTLDRDPFDGSIRPLNEVKRGLTTLPPGALVAWDSHFGPAEVGLPLGVLMGRSNLELLRSFELEGDKERSGPASSRPEVHVFRVR